MKLLFGLLSLAYANVYEVGYWSTTCDSWLNLYSVTRKVLNLLLLSDDLMTALMQVLRMLD